MFLSLLKYRKEKLFFSTFFLVCLFAKPQSCDVLNTASDNCQLLGNNDYVSTLVNTSVCNNPFELIPEGSDEFDGNSIDLSKWLYAPPWGGGANFIYSLEYFTQGDNIEVSNGILKFSSI